MSNLVPYIEQLSIEEQEFLVERLKSIIPDMGHLHRGLLPFVSFKKAEWALGSNWYLGHEEPYTTYKRLQISLIKKLRTAANSYVIKAYELGQHWPQLPDGHLFHPEPHQ